MGATSPTAGGSTCHNPLAKGSHNSQWRRLTLSDRDRMFSKRPEHLDLVRASRAVLSSSSYPVGVHDLKGGGRLGLEMCI